MPEWSVEGRGAEVTVTSSEGDVYSFHIASVADLRLELCVAPTWHTGQAPAEADLRLGEAFDEASRWTEDMFGPAGA